MTFDGDESELFPNHQNDEKEVEIVEQKPNVEVMKKPPSLKEAFKAILQSYPDKQYSTVDHKK